MARGVACFLVFLLAYDRCVVGSRSSGFGEGIAVGSWNLHEGLV